MIQRSIKEVLINNINSYPVTLVTGARQIGKSTLFYEITNLEWINNNSIKGFKALENSKYMIDKSCVICLNESVYKINEDVYVLPVSVI